jgi:predicted enzyme related to lactoylglutathione lyase
MNITEIAFTGYAVSDIRKSRAFYEGVLGLKPASIFEKGDMGFIEYEIGPHTLSIGAGAPLMKPGSTGGTVAFEVTDFDAAMKKITEAGVKVIMPPYDSGPCTMTLIEDPDGNRIMIHTRKKS